MSVDDMLCCTPKVADNEYLLSESQYIQKVHDILAEHFLMFITENGAFGITENGRFFV